MKYFYAMGLAAGLALGGNCWAQTETLRLVIKDAHTGWAVAGATMRYSLRNSAGHWSASANEPTFAANERGEIEVSGLPAAQAYQFEISSPAYIAQRSFYRASAQDANAPYIISLRPERPQQASGILRDRNSGQPIERGQLTIRNLAGTDSMRISIGAGGRYAFPIQPNTDYSLEVEAVGFLPATDTLSAAEIANASAQTELRTELSIPLDLRATAQGGYATNDTIALPELQFKPRASTLAPQADASLDSICTIFQQNPTIELEIRVHSRADQSERLAWLLARERAEKIRLHLSQCGINAERFAVEAIGSEERRTGENGDRVEIRVRKGTR